MITFKRKTTLNWVVNPTAFQAINTTALIVDTLPLGSTLTAVNKMLACAEEMEIIFPEILGVSPKANSTDWQNKLQNYWYNFDIDVPKKGYDFDNSLVFDMTDYRRKDYINALIEELGLKNSKEGDKKATTKDIEKKLFDYITSDKVPETARYKYMSPVNIANYFAWRYCLVSSKVANDAVDMRNSRNIDFYLVDEATLTANKEAINQLKTTAVKKFYELVSASDSTSTIENLLIADELVLSLQELKELSASDSEAKLLEVVTTNPERFMALVDDVTIRNKAEIKKWEMAALIRKLPNTTIYLDSSDASITLGNTLDDVVGYVSAEVNAAYVNELRLKFKNINN